MRNKKKIKGGAAYRVSYCGPTGPCPDAVITFSTDECGALFDITPLAGKARGILVDARGGAWRHHDIAITGMQYIGPWFHPSSPTSHSHATEGSV